MAKLTENISSLVKEAAKIDKREQLIPETKPKYKPVVTNDHSKP